MSYNHVRIGIRGETHDETKLDLDEATLERMVLAPYRQGLPITINGRTIPIEDVTRIRVTSSDVPGSTLMEMVRQERNDSKVGIIGGPSTAWRAAAKATDVTDQFITGPPGRMDVTPHTLRGSERAGSVDRRSVFLVAGRDNAAVDAVLAFVRALGLRVVEWDHAVARTGIPNPYVGDVVVAGMGMADATLVLLTPDDVVSLRPDLVRDSDTADERSISGQARPNVYYEAGIADALGRERTVIVEVGRVKPFSDVAGRHVVRFDGTDASRNSLVSRLILAGLEPDRTGNGWLRAGDVTGAITAARSAFEALNKK